MGQSKLSKAPATTRIEPMALPSLGESPLVSIIVANYNYGRFLPDMAQSVLDQTYSNWELIICDDGSTDDSAAILQHLDECDPRIRPLFKENGGQASAWNLAYEHGRGEIICLLDADDRFNPWKLSTVVSAFLDHPKAGLLYHSLQPTDRYGTPSGEALPRDLPSGWLFGHAVPRAGFVFVPITSSLCLRRDVAHLLFPIPEQLGNYGDTYIGMTTPFVTEIAAIDTPLALYRQHEVNHSGSNIPNHPSALRNGIKSVLTAFPHQQKFLGKMHGDAVAKKVSAHKLTWFWENIASLHILDGKPVDGVMGFNPGALPQSLRHSRKRLLLSVCFALPHPLSRWLLQLQFISSRTMKSMRWRITRLLGRLPFNGRRSTCKPQIVRPNSHGGSS
jgi:glycosyltransferase involved in cell wall biosynthesis